MKLFDIYRIIVIKEYMNYRDSEYNNIDVIVRYCLFCKGYIVNKYLIE